MKLHLFSSVILILLFLVSSFSSATHFHSDAGHHSDCALCLLAGTPATIDQPDCASISFVPVMDIVRTTETAYTKFYAFVDAIRAPPSA